jgi:hypothetical protein
MTNSSVTPQETPNVRPAAAQELPSVIWGAAIEAAWKTLVLLVLGNVAISLVSGIFHDMIPSLPPGFAEGETTNQSTYHYHWHFRGWFHGSLFYPVFGLLFAGILWSRWRGPATTPATTRRMRRLQRIQQSLRENWFGLIVGNAFGAMITVVVALWIQRFSSVQWSWTQFILPAIHGVVESVFGQHAVQAIDSWFDWFGQNQPKFDFWFVYFAAVCDDLGIPNIKTLGRWVWGRVKKTYPRIARINAN